MAVDVLSAGDPVEALYNRRVRGLGVLVAADDTRMHAATGCWFMLAAGTPPRLVVSIPHEFPTLTLLREAGTFTVNLVGIHQRSQIEPLRVGTEPPSLAWWQVPSGALCLPGSTGIFDCVAEGERDVGDSTLIWAAVTAAGGRREEPNLTSNDLPPLSPEALAMRPHDWARPRPPLAMARLPERADAVYRRRRWGAMAIVMGTKHDWVGGLTTGMMQVSHEPGRFAWFLNPGGAAAKKIAHNAHWSAAVASRSLVEFTHLPRQAADESLRWEGDAARLPGALAHFSGVVEDAWTVGGRLLVLGVVKDLREGPDDEANIERDDAL